MAESVAPPWEAYGGKTAAPPPPPHPATLWQGVKDAASSAVNYVKEGIDAMPARRAEARTQLKAEGNNPMALVERAKKEWPKVQKAATDFTSDFTTKPQNGMGFRVLGTALDAANVPFQAATSAISTAIGPQLQAVTGMPADLASSLLVPAKAMTMGLDATKLRPALGKAAAPTLAKGGALYKEAVRTVNPAGYDAGAKAAADMHREVFGRRGAEADRAIYSMKEHAPTLAKLTKQGLRDFMDYIEDKPGAAWASRNPKGMTVSDFKAYLDERGVPEAWRLKLVREFQKRAKGMVGGEKPKLPPALQKAADDYRAITLAYRDRAEAIIGDKVKNWREDWAPHQWKNDRNPTGQSGVEGSGRSFMSRTFDYFTDALDAGKVPVHSNPVDMLNSYVENMGRFLGQHDILHGPNGMVEKLGAVPVKEGTRPPEGFVKLEGNLAHQKSYEHWQKDPETGQSVKVAGAARDYYAPKGAATIYNRHVSQGFQSGIAKGALGTSNALKMMKLGLSGFHAFTMANEAVVSDIAKAVQQATRGQVGKAAVSLAKAPAAPITSAMRGGKMFGQMIGGKEGTAVEDTINKLYERVGGRVHMDKIYGTRASGSFFNSWRRGTFKEDLKNAAAKVYSGDEKMKSAFDLAGNIVQSTAAPLFEKYIPALKRGAWAKAMEDYVAAHPNLEHKELEEYGRKMLDSIDNRFGEMQTDNLFWSKTAQQGLQMALLSPSWTFGTAREIGGGLANLPKSIAGVAAKEGVDPKTAYNIALAMHTATMGGAITYLMTGEKPHGEDFIAGRTGGTTTYGSGKFETTVPERAALPGYQKDVLAAVMGDPMAELWAKTNIPIKAGKELLENKDWRGDPIYGKPEGVEASGLGDYLTDMVSPISVVNAGKGQQAGSKIGTAATLAGVRPSPRYVQDAEGSAATHEALNKRDWERKAKREANDKRKRGDAPPPWEQYK